MSSQNPTIDELSAVAIEQLVKTPADISEVEQFEDDHEPCINATVNGVKVSFWWLAPEEAAAFYYQDSPNAQGVIAAVIADAIVNDEISCS